MANVNVEKVVIGWLSLNIGSGWAVFGDQPKLRPEKYVLVDRTGGPRESMVLDKAEILIEVYHKNSRLEASDKAYDLGDILPQLVALEPITRSKVNSIVKLDDIVGQYWRYQIYVDIFARRQVVAVDLEYPILPPDATEDQSFVYPFINLSTIIVQHNMGKYPSVRVEDSAGDDVELEVEYNDLNKLTLYSSASFSGTVYLN